LLNRFRIKGLWDGKFTNWVLQRFQIELHR
jgi:hypothetical protein